MKTSTRSSLWESKLAKRSAALILSIVALTALITLSACSGAAAKSTLTVDLKSHGATGYTWVYGADPSDVLKEKSHDTKADTSVAGGDVVDTFVFTAEKSTGSSEGVITFSLERPWEDAEGNESPETVSYTFKIDEAKNITLTSKTGTASDIPEPVIS